jgi:hypothetical protein
VVSVTVTSKLRGLELALGVGVELEAVPTLPQPEVSMAAATTSNRILISKT